MILCHQQFHGHVERQLSGAIDDETVCEYLDLNVMRRAVVTMADGVCDRLTERLYRILPEAVMLGLRADDDALADVPLDEDQCFVNLVLYIAVYISAVQNIATVILESSRMDDGLWEFDLWFLGEEKIGRTGDFRFRFHPFKFFQNVPWIIVIGEIAPFLLDSLFHVSANSIHVKIVTSHAGHDHRVHACAS